MWLIEGIMEMTTFTTVTLVMLLHCFACELCDMSHVMTAVGWDLGLMIMKYKWLIHGWIEYKIAFKIIKFLLNCTTWFNWNMIFHLRFWLFFYYFTIPEPGPHVSVPEVLNPKLQDVLDLKLKKPKSRSNAEPDVPEPVPVVWTLYLNLEHLYLQQAFIKFALIKFIESQSKTN